jgi:hypothetical protein
VSDAPKHGQSLSVEVVMVLQNLQQNINPANPFEPFFRRRIFLLRRGCGGFTLYRLDASSSAYSIPDQPASDRGSTYTHVYQAAPFVAGGSSNPARFDCRGVCSAVGVT